MKVYEIVSKDNLVDEGLKADLTKKIGRWWSGKRRKAQADAARAARQDKSWLTGRAKYSVKNLTGRELADAVAKRAAAGNRARALAKIKSFGGTFMNVLSMLGIAYYVQDYWTNIDVVETQWEEYLAALKSGKVPEGNMFVNEDGTLMEHNEALAKAQEIRQELLGKATAGILAVGGFLGKFISGFGSIVKIVPIPGFGIAGSALKGLGALFKLGESQKAIRLSALAWLETSETGKELMQHWIAVSFLRAVGYGTDRFLKLLETSVDELEKWLEEKTGLDVPGVPDALRSKIKPDPEEEKRTADRDAKKIYVNDVLVTDYDGYLTTSRDILLSPKIKNEIWRAKQAGQPSPLAAIPKKPGASYPPEVLN